MLLAVVTVGSAAAAFSKGTIAASADRSVPLSGSSIFFTSYDSKNGSSADNALLWAHRELTPVSDVTYSEYYLSLVFVNNNSRVDYRKNLAYSWYYNGEDDKKPYVLKDRTNQSTVVSEAHPEKAQGYFNMELGFTKNSDGKLVFSEYAIAFDSQQAYQTKDGKSTNYIKFIPSEDGAKVGVLITDDKDAATLKSGAVYLDPAKITISFTAKTLDGYKVKVSSGAEYTEGEFKNVGGNYSKYSSSSTTPVTPLSFSAKFPENLAKPAEGKPAYDNYARMTLYSLNGQTMRIGSFSEATTSTSFAYGTKQKNDAFGDTYAYFAKKGGKYEASTEYNETYAYYTYNPGVSKHEDGHFYASTLNVNDDAAPVLAFDTDPTFIKTGGELPFSFNSIDVLASAPSAKTYYYMLTDNQSKTTNFNANNVNDDKLFSEVNDSQNKYMEPHVGHYLPKNGDLTDAYAALDDVHKCNVTAAVKVYYDLYDTSSESLQQTTKVLLDWYVDDDNLVSVGGNKYVAIASDDRGATYAYTDLAKKISSPEAGSDSSAEAVTLANKWKAMVEAYQTLVDAAAKDLKAGSKNYFYLPALNDIEHSYLDAAGVRHTERGALFGDNIANYETLKFGIYYSNGTKGSSTSRAYNNLSINISKAKTYLFTVYAQDGDSNDMFYYKDGEVKTFSASSVWDMRDNKNDFEGLAAFIPWFSFDVEASEITIETPGDRETAYVYTAYSGINFDINGVEYDTTYELYRFDNELYYAAKGKALRYDEYMKWINGDFECAEHGNSCKLLENHPEWFTLIPAKNTLTEGSQNYKTFVNYAWDTSALTFVPQDENTFYLVSCTAKSNSEYLKPAVAYMGISSSASVEKLKGEDTWVQDNLTSIILLAIAGASLIGIILLLVIKPKEETDVDALVVVDKKQETKSSKTTDKK